LDSLTRDPAARPTPKDLLEHPWIVNVMKQEVNTALWLRRVWGWRRGKSERYVILIAIFSHLHFLYFDISFWLFLFSTTLLLFFTSPSPASTIRASAFPRKKSLLQRILANFYCSSTLPEGFDEVVTPKQSKDDEDDHSLLFFPARDRGRVGATHSNLQWLVSESTPTLR
jgi:hypothetical protein